MKLFLLFSLLVFSTSSFSNISPVNQGTPIEASKINQIIDEVNSFEAVVGPQGPQGIQGLPGTNGAQGIQGLPGANGAQGLKGDTGDAGTQGIQGLKGDTGNDGAAGVSISVGMIVNSAAACPSGYLLADGSEVSRTGATLDLFNAIGVTFGSGNGTTTFNLPTTIKCTSDLNCENVFSATITAAGVVSKENLDWISTTSVSVSSYTLNINPVAASLPLNCSVTTSLGQALTVGLSQTSSTVSYIIQNAGTTANLAAGHQIICEKQGADFKPLSKSPSLFNKCIKL